MKELKDDGKEHLCPEMHAMTKLAGLAKELHDWIMSSKQDKICHSFTNSDYKGILDDIYPSVVVRARTFLDSLITD